MQHAKEMAPLLEQRCRTWEMPMEGGFSTSAILPRRRPSHKRPTAAELHERAATQAWSLAYTLGAVALYGVMTLVFSAGFAAAFGAWPW